MYECTTDNTERPNHVFEINTPGVCSDSRAMPEYYRTSQGATHSNCTHMDGHVKITPPFGRFSACVTNAIYKICGTVVISLTSLFSNHLSWPTETTYSQVGSGANITTLPVLRFCTHSHAHGASEDMRIFVSNCVVNSSALQIITKAHHHRGLLCTHRSHPCSNLVFR